MEGHSGSSKALVSLKNVLTVATIHLRTSYAVPRGGCLRLEAQFYYTTSLYLNLSVQILIFIVDCTNYQFIL